MKARLGKQHQSRGLRAPTTRGETICQETQTTSFQCLGSIWGQLRISFHLSLTWAHTCTRS